MLELVGRKNDTGANGGTDAVSPLFPAGSGSPLPMQAKRVRDEERRKRRKRNADELRWLEEKEFDESQHPRDERGRFSDGGESGDALPSTPKTEELVARYRADRKYNPMDWAAEAARGVAPWQRPEADFAAGQVPGFRYSGDTFPGQTGGDVLAYANVKDGTITVAAPFFRLSEDDKRFTVLHEAGHTISTLLLADERGQALMKQAQAADQGADWKYPAEAIAYEYAGQAEFPRYEYTDQTPFGDYMRSFQSTVADAARDLGLPLKEAKEWDESQHPRDDHGRFSTAGSEGGDDTQAMPSSATVVAPSWLVTGPMADVAIKTIGELSARPDDALERGVLVGGDGAIIADKEGDPPNAEYKGSVTFDKEELYKAADGIVIHSHPDNMGPSPGDIIIASRVDAKAVVTVHGDDTWIVQRTGDNWPPYMTANVEWAWQNAAGEVKSNHPDMPVSELDRVTNDEQGPKSDAIRREFTEAMARKLAESGMTGVEMKHYDSSDIAGKVEHAGPAEQRRAGFAWKARDFSWPTIRAFAPPDEVHAALEKIARELGQKDWDEGAHPRDEAGRFSTSDEGSEPRTSMGQGEPIKDLGLALIAIRDGLGRELTPEERKAAIDIIDVFRKSNLELTPARIIEELKAKEPPPDPYSTVTSDPTKGIDSAPEAQVTHTTNPAPDPMKNANVLAAVQELALRGEHAERGIVLDADGNIVSDTEGREPSADERAHGILGVVEYKPEEWEQGRFGITIHSHPTDWAQSDQDIINSAMLQQQGTLVIHDDHGWLVRPTYVDADGHPDWHLDDFARSGPTAELYAEQDTARWAQRNPDIMAQETNPPQHESAVQRKFTDNFLKQLGKLEYITVRQVKVPEPGAALDRAPRTAAATKQQGVTVKRWAWTPTNFPERMEDLRRMVEEALAARGTKGMLLVGRRAFDEDLHPRDDRGRFADSGIDFDKPREPEWNADGSPKMENIDQIVGFGQYEPKKVDVSAREGLYGGMSNELANNLATAEEALQAANRGREAHEEIRALDADGKVVVKMAGELDKVGIPEHAHQKMAGLVVTHNHPSGRSFSVDDIQTAVSGHFAEIRAVGKDYTYIMRGTQDFDRSPSEVNGVYSGVARDKMMITREAYIDGVWREAAPKLGLTYERVATSKKEFDESRHPRDTAGRFSESDESGTGMGSVKHAYRVMDETPSKVHSTMPVGAALMAPDGRFFGEHNPDIGRGASHSMLAEMLGLGSLDDAMDKGFVRTRMHESTVEGWGRQIDVEANDMDGVRRAAQGVGKDVPDTTTIYYDTQAGSGKGSVKLLASGGSESKLGSYGRFMQSVGARALRFLTGRRAFDEDQHPRDEHGRFTTDGDQYADANGVSLGTREELLNNALSAWKGNPSSTHIADVLDGTPWKWGQSRSGDEMRARAEVLVDAVTHAPVTESPLYRGLVVAPQALERMQPGAPLGGGRELAGFTSDKRTARSFSREGIGSQGSSVIVKLESGAAALRIADHIRSGLDETEKEFISRGPFNIVSRDDKEKVVELTVRQSAEAKKDWDEGVHPRDQSGRFTDVAGGELDVSRGASGRLAKLLRSKGGFTYSAYSLRIPTTGKVVSIHPEAEQTVEKGQAVTAAMIRAYAEERQGLLALKGEHVGAWHDAESGKVYLDVSRVVSTHEEAARLAHEYHQEAYYDIDTQTTVYTRAREKGRRWYGVLAPREPHGRRLRGARASPERSAWDPASREAGEAAVARLRAQKDMRAILDDPLFWHELRRYVEKAALPVFTELYMGGQEAALRLAHVRGVKIKAFDETQHPRDDHGRFATDEAWASGEEAGGRTADEEKARVLDWLDRHETPKNARGEYVFYHGAPKATAKTIERDGLAPGSLLADTREEAEFFAARDRDLKPSQVRVYEVPVRPQEIRVGQWAQLRGSYAPDRLGVKDFKDTPDPELEQRLAQRAAIDSARLVNDWWAKLEATTRAQLEQLLRSGPARDPEAALDLGVITSGIAELFGPERANRIAVTETTNVMGQAAQATYAELGVDGWEWRTAEDDRVDQVCDDLADGSPYPIDEPFIAAHVNCRCWPVPVLGAFKEFDEEKHPRDEHGRFASTEGGDTGTIEKQPWYMATPISVLEARQSYAKMQAYHQAVREELAAKADQYAAGSPNQHINEVQAQYNLDRELAWRFNEEHALDPPAKLPPELEGLQGRVWITDGDEPGPYAKQCLEDLAKVPIDVQKDLAEQGLKIFIGSDLKFNELNGNAEKTDEKVRGWPSGDKRYLEELSGAFSPLPNQVILAGAGRGGGESVALHELGHAIDWNLRLDDKSGGKTVTPGSSLVRPSQSEAYARVYDEQSPTKRNGYFNSADSGHGVQRSKDDAREEAFAEQFASLAKYGPGYGGGIDGAGYTPAYRDVLFAATDTTRDDWWAVVDAENAKNPALSKELQLPRGELADGTILEPPGAPIGGRAAKGLWIVGRREFDEGAHPRDEHGRFTDGAPSLDDVPATVDQWYDRSTRSWVTQIKDHRGYQIGEAAYDGRKVDAQASKKSAENVVERAKREGQHTHPESALGPEHTHAQKDFDEGQHPRDEHGRFTSGGEEQGAVLTDREQSMAKKYFAEHRLTAKAMGKHLRSLISHASPAMVQKGMEWYAKAHEYANDLAKQYGVQPDTAAAVIAALSPRARWSEEEPHAEIGWKNTNQDQAERVLRTVAEGEPITISREQAAASYERDLASPQAQRRNDALDAEHYNGIDDARHGEDFTGKRFDVQDLPSDVVAAFHPGVSGSLRESATKAIELARGADPDETLTGNKVRSFYNDIVHPESDSVTIDGHQVRAMRGSNELSDYETQMTVNTPGKYEFMAQSLREEAAREDMSPKQLQAISWLQWREEHPFDERRAITSGKELALTDADLGPDFWPQEIFDALVADDDRTRAGTKGLVLVGSKYNENHDEHGRFASSDSGGDIDARNEGRTTAAKIAVSTIREGMNRMGLPGPRLSQVEIVEDSFRKEVDRLNEDAKLGVEEKSPEQVKAALEDTAREVIANSDVAIRLPRELVDEVLEGGVKNQHETGTSAGWLGNDLRAGVEQMAFGISQDSAPDKFPVYGYLSNPTAERTNIMSQYGDVRVVLKDDVQERTTYTHGDSLGAINDSYVQPAPLREPNALAERSDLIGMTLNQGGPRTWNEPYAYVGGYWETQIHGGVSPGDIDRIEYTRNPIYEAEGWGDEKGIEKLNELDRQIQMAQERGIPVRVEIATSGGSQLADPNSEEYKHYVEVVRRGMQDAIEGKGHRLHAAP